MLLIRVPSRFFAECSPRVTSMRTRRKQAMISALLRAACREREREREKRTRTFKGRRVYSALETNAQTQSSRQKKSPFANIVRRASYRPVSSPVESVASSRNKRCVHTSARRTCISTAYRTSRFITSQRSVCTLYKKKSRSRQTATSIVLLHAA